MRHPSSVERVCRRICLLGALALLAVPAAVTGQTPATPPSKATPAAPADAGKGMRMDMGKGMDKDKGMGMGAGEGDMRSAMMASMKGMDSMKMSGNTDRDFASMMKIHHQSAIDMAQMELKNGKDGKMRALAKRIIAEQQKEIKEIDGWLATQK